MAIVAPTPIPDAPTPPDRANRASFSADATAWADYQKDDLVPGVNAVADNVYDNALEAEASATAAAASVVAAGNHVTTALGHANAAAASAVEAAGYAASALNAPGTSATSTTSLTIGTGSKSLTVQTGKDFVVGQAVVIANTTTPSDFMWGQITAYNSGTGALTVDVDAIGGGGTLSAWTVSVSVSPAVATGPSVGTSAQTTDYTIVTADLGKLIMLTGATSRTFTTPAAATVGAGWYCYVQNGGDDTAEAADPVKLTIDGNASETIDGVATVTEYRGGALLITTDGSNWTALRIAGGFARYTQAGTFTWPSRVSGAYIDVVGAGGGGAGGGTNGATYPCGGGGGARVFGPAVAKDVNTATTTTVGASGTGGTGNTTSGNAGTAGGFSHFQDGGNYYRAGGGGRGGLSTAGSGGAQYSSGTDSSSRNTAPQGLTYSTPPDAWGFAGGGGTNGGSTNSAGRAEFGGGGGASKSGTSAANAAGGSVFGGGGGGAGAYGGAGVSNAGQGGASGQYATGGGGTAGVSGASPTAGGVGTSRSYGAGDGGGGGGGANTGGTNGTNGGNGGVPGGGGGGAGQGNNSSYNGGNGGNGGRGEIRVWYW